MKDLKQFIGIYPLSKTLCFELRPIGKTSEWMEKSHIVETDKKKAEDYPRVKALIDKYHKKCIEESLKDIHLDWSGLKSAIEDYRKSKTDKTREALTHEQKEMCKKIANAFELFPYFKELTSTTPDKLIKTIISGSSNDDALKPFRNFSTYFRGLQERRKSIYDPDSKSGVPHRIVYDNFHKFLANLDVYANIKEICPDVIKQVSTKLEEYLGGVKIEDVFTLEYYNSLLTQKGIEFFNSIVGGVSLAEGKPKLGMNVLTSNYRQIHPEVSTKKKALTMVPLFKQILSDRDTLSFVPISIDNDQQLKESIEKFYSHIISFEWNGENIDLLDELAKLENQIDSFDPTGIYVASNKTTELSQKLFGDWRVIRSILKNQAAQKYGNIESEDEKTKKIDHYVKEEDHSLIELNLQDEHSLSQYFNDVSQLVSSIHSYWLAFKEWSNVDEPQLFLNNDDGTEIVKKLLDATMTFMHKSSVLNVSGDYAVDENFYNVYSPLYSELRAIIPLYNRARNYLTRKHSNIKKFKLTFNVSALADGWDQNKEKDCKVILLFKEGKSFLGIINRKRGKIIFPNRNVQTTGTEECYSKMVYKLLKPHILSHVIFSEKRAETYNPPQDVLKIHRTESFKKDSQHLHRLIDFYKEAINRNPDWSIFDFVFSQTESYENINDFYKEIAKQGYKISFTNIPIDTVNEWVDNGQLYLFQLYNKDYEEGVGANAHKNLHTLYWENLFTKANLNKLVLRLNGKAELFCRPQSIQKPIAHRKGSKMVNRRDKSGKPIPDSIYQHLIQYYNGKMAKESLADEELKYLDKVIVKDVTHDIVKDERFTRQEYFFHVPITLNVNAEANNLSNDAVWAYIKDNPDINIIGIDRGERNLIYLTLINQNGEILKQKSFNTIGNFNYHDKLKQREKERIGAHKSWASLGKIKDLKEGFLSAVIHEIALMMVKYNAIVVLEDLKFGGKQGSFKVESQVYRKFEKMLIGKLNYLSFKDRSADEEGGILRGYQLTQRFASFQRLGMQSGFLFYVPAAYTSKIDPVTGFVGHFNFTDVTSTEKRKKFFMKMERIEMRDGHIEFTFDYRKYTTFLTDYQNVWTVSSVGNRIVMIRDENKHWQIKDFDPTEFIVQAFNEKGITLTDGMDLKARMESIDGSDFYNKMFYAFKKVLQMRNSNSRRDDIISPVQKDGKYFSTESEAKKGKDSNKDWISRLPVDADANGAYHIALKGLYLLMHPDAMKIEHSEWLKFMVEKPYMKKKCTFFEIFP